MGPIKEGGFHFILCLVCVFFFGDPEIDFVDHIVMKKR